MPRSEDSKKQQYAYNQKYQLQNIIQKKLVFNRTNETDLKILAWLDSLKEAICPYIKRLILEDMARSATEKSSPDQ